MRNILDKLNEARKKSNNILRNNYLYLILFSVFYFFIRIPNFITGWDGTDANGIHLDILLNQRTGPNYIKIGQINGVEMLGSPDHPALMYEVFSKIGNIFGLFLNYTAVPYMKVVSWTKILVSSMQLFFYISLLILVFSKVSNLKKRVAFLLSVIAFSTTPLAINSSNEFQLDSFIGWFCIGWFCIFIAAAEFKILNGLKLYACIFISGLLIGTGKNEWSLLFISGLGLALFFLFAKQAKHGDCTREFLGIIFSASIGCLIGNLLSYYYDPINYMAGWNLVTKMSHASSILSDNGFTNFLRLTKERRIYIYPIIILLILSTLKITNTINALRPSLVLYCVASCLFMGFFFSTWGAYPRYFAPSFIAIIFLGGINFATQPFQVKLNTRSILIACLLILILTHGIKHAFSKEILRNHHWGMVQYHPKVGCIYSLPIEATHDGGNSLNFIVSGMGQDFAIEVGKTHGLELCN